MADETTTAPVDHALQYMLSFELQAVRSVFTAAHNRLPGGASEASQAFEAALADLQTRLNEQVERESAELAPLPASPPPE